MDKQTRRRPAAVSDDPWAIDDRKRTEFDYGRLEDVIKDPLFPQIDFLLRSGAHVDIDDIRRYEFLNATAPFLEDLYSRYKCSLVHGPEGYYYLLSEGAMFGRKRLGSDEMLVGQTLALMSMDPMLLKTAGRIRIEQILSTLEMLLGQERLSDLLAPRKRGKDQERDNEKIRENVGKALRTLRTLNFIAFVSDDEVITKKSIMRFADPVRDSSDRVDSLAALVRNGTVMMGSQPDLEEDGDTDED